jgi:IrrE N-terminal-like domain
MDEVEAARAALARFTDTYACAAPPVDVEELAGSLCRLRVRDADDLCPIAGLPAKTPLSGVLLPARWEIWVRRDEPGPRRRFTVAHEVGHHLLHSDGAAVLCRPADVEAARGDERTREREANRFAAELLMPEPLVREHADRDGPDPIALAECFGVSDVAMGYRLVNLGYLTALPVAIQAELDRWRHPPV